MIWNTNDEADCFGELELLPKTVELLGVGDHVHEAQVSVRLSDIDSIYVERCAPPRNSWEPALVLVTRGGDRIAIGSLEGLGALHELAESVEHGRRHVAA